MIEDDMKFEQVARYQEQQRLAKEASQLEKEGALNSIGEMETHLGVLGGNDTEILDLEVIRKKLEDNEISPATARKAAHKVVNDKMDYH